MGKCLSRDVPNIRGRNIINPDDLPDFPYQNQVIKCRVYDVYDGDTISITYKIDRIPVKAKIRLLGIDAPEIRSGKDRLPEEKVAAKICRDYLSSLILGKEIDIVMTNFDKYGGRYLGQIYMPNDPYSINKLMIDMGYARPYTGEKKQPWDLSELNSIIGK